MLQYMQLPLIVEHRTQADIALVSKFSLGPALRPGRVMVLMCLSVCVLVCLSPPEAWTFRYLLDTLDL